MAQLLNKIRRLFVMAVVVRDTVRNRVRYLQIELPEGFGMDDIEHLEPFGFTSRCLGGAEAVVLSQGGNRGKAVCILTPDRKYRIVIGEGETAIYNRHGDKVHLRDDRTIECVTPVRVLMSTPLVECTGNFVVRGNAQIYGNSQVGGDHTVGGEFESIGRGIINDSDYGTHYHTDDDNDTSGGPRN